MTQQAKVILLICFQKLKGQMNVVKCTTMKRQMPQHIITNIEINMCHLNKQTVDPALTFDRLVFLEKVCIW